MRPIYITLGCVKISYTSVFVCKEAIKRVVSTTTEIVATTAKSIGKNIAIIIDIRTKRGGIFPKYFGNNCLLLNEIKIKQPAAISQNLDGIKKYADDWLYEYKYIKVIKERIDKKLTIKNKLREPFLL